MEEKKIITNERRFYPLLVSSNGDLEKQTNVESEQVWEKIDTIPENNKRILLGTNIIENLYNAEQTFGWEPYYSVRMAYFIRELFFQGISQSEFYKAVEALFAEKYGNRLNEILAFINNTILTSQPDPDEPEEDELVEASEESLIPQENMRQYTLLDALSKYPYIGNQPITTDNIKLKSQVALVRPTLTNWLKNYRDELGIGMHDAVARAKFLFESQNTHKLPSNEREHIHALVRSLEDNELLSIDTKKQVIIFTNRVQEKPSGANQKNEDVSEEATQDIFERFQNINMPASDTRTQLGSVGTQTFGGGKIQGADLASNETSVLSRIKNMSVSAPKANAPAPREDFTAPRIQPVPQSVLSPEPQVPLGTLRFSAKHILPAERQNLQKTPATVLAQPLGVDNRMEHFRPQPVFIPGAPAPQPMHTPIPQTPLPESVKNTILAVPIQPSASVPAAPIFTPPAITKKHLEEPRSMFRIKPNRD